MNVETKQNADHPYAGRSRGDAGFRLSWLSGPTIPRGENEVGQRLPRTVARLQNAHHPQSYSDATACRGPAKDDRPPSTRGARGADPSPQSADHWLECVLCPCRQRPRLSTARPHGVYDAVGMGCLPSSQENETLDCAQILESGRWTRLALPTLEQYEASGSPRPHTTPALCESARHT